MDTRSVLGNSAEMPASGRSLLDQVEAFLAGVLQDLEPTGVPPHRGRPRILPALALWGGLLVGVLRGDSHQLTLWRRLSQVGLWSYPRFPISDQAVYKRLATAGTAPLEQVFAHISALLVDRLAPWSATDLAPFAPVVVALDETTLDPVARTLPPRRPVPRGAVPLLPGKLAGLFDVRRQQWQRVQYLPDPVQNERVAAAELVADLPRHSLVLADLGYWSYPWLDGLSARGLWWISRLRAKTSYQVQHRFYADAQGTVDALIWLGAHRADRAGRAVRLVSYRRGAQTYSYVTNVVDPRVLPLAEIARLYARRWDIELAFRLVKRELGLHLLWSAQVAVLLHQVWAVLIISQVLQGLRLEIAGRAGVDPFAVSLPLLVQYLPQFAEQGEDPIQVFVARGRAAGFIRPSRRTVVAAPLIPVEALLPLPPDVPLERPPRYAGRISKTRRYPRRTLSSN